MRIETDNVILSVILPSLNVVEYINECLYSVVNQTLKNIEIICVDAGSNDGTLDIITRYVRSDDRIKLIHSDVKSYGAQINRGISIAKGKYIAILETDDFIDSEMYKTLVNIAEYYNADYVKADYNKFYATKLGEYVYIPCYQFDEYSGLYNKVINPHRIDCLYKSDYNIWRGIYNKQFIIENNITLNETEGAAYQDIGFVQLLFANATKAVYIRKNLYNYRKGRLEASSYSKRALSNTKTEFERLYMLFNNYENIYWRGFYLHLATDFLFEYRNTLRACRFNYNDYYCSHNYQWFKDRVLYAINKKVITFEDIGKNYGAQLERLIFDPKNFTEYIKKIEIDIPTFVRGLNYDEDTNFIVFGVGMWGIKVIEAIIDYNFYHVVAAVDNDINKIGKSIDGVKIYSLKEAVEKYSKAVIFVANEKHHDEIIDQIHRTCQNKVVCPFR